MSNNIKIFSITFYFYGITVNSFGNYFRIFLKVPMSESTEKGTGIPHQRSC